jgi:predicted ATPase
VIIAEKSKGKSMDRYVLISGCSGGGKSSLLSELQRRGYCVVEEPGRRIVAEEVAKGGNVLPWDNLAVFASKAIEVSRKDRQHAENHTGLVFFDRGLIDAACALEYATGTQTLASVSSERYHQLVFLTPPWPEIYVTDSERKHSFDAAVAEYNRLLSAFANLNYDTEILPFVGVSERADFILSKLLERHEKY